MTFEAQLVPSGHRYRVRTPEEDARAFRAASRHSRLVRILRKALPIMAVVIFAAYFISTRLSVTVGGVTASVNGIEVKDGNLRMLKPTLKGVDKKKGAYVISADYADQDMKNPKLVRLHNISAEVNSDSKDKDWSRVNAVRGMFNSESQRLALQDDIRVATSSGLVGKLSYATIAMDSQVIRSHSPVTFDMPNAKITSNALTLRSSESTLIFRGKVRLHIDRTDNKSAPQAAGNGAPPRVEAPPTPAREPAAPSVAVQAPPPQAPIASVPSAPVEMPSLPSAPVQMPAMPQ